MSEHEPGTGADVPGRALRWLARLAEAAAATQAHLPASALPPAPGAPDPRRVGIVFVHGIGDQKPGATLLEWSGTLLAALAAWRMRLEGDGTQLTWDAAGPWPPDGVVHSELHLGGGQPSLVEVVVPGIEGRPDAAGQPQRWLLTESWWAADVEPPTLAQVADWTGRDGVLGRVAFGIVGPRVRGLQRLLAPGLGLFISATGFLALLGFQVVRAIGALVPIPSVRTALTARKVGNFLVDWWGDVFVLLRDPAQAASIRGTLAASIRMLREHDCDAVVVIGHSGGTIVAYTTLSDPAFGDLAADTFISHGEAIRLARTIVRTAPPPKGMTSERTTLGNLQTEPLGPRVANAEPAGALRVGRWHDFYGTHDPATFGEPLEDCAQPGTDRATTAVVNRMSVREDHGSYWTNDEEFVQPVLREIDVAGLPGATSRFAEVSRTAIDRRRQRVAVRSAWGRAALVMPIVAVLAALAYLSPGIGIVRDAGTFAPGLIGSMGRAVGQGIGAIPGADLVGGVLGALGSAVAGTAPAVGTAAGLVAAFALGLIFAFAFVYAVVPVRAWDRFTSRRGRILAGFVDLGLSLLVLVAAGAVIAGWGTGPLDVPGYGPAPILGVVAGPVAVAAYAVLLGAWEDAVERLPALDDIATAIGVMGLAILVLSVAWSAVFDPAIQAWMLGLAAVVVVVQIVIRIGIARWGVWDAHERSAVRLRPDAPQALGRLRVVAAGTVGFGALLVMVDAIARGDGTRLVAAVAVAVVFGIGLAITDVERVRVTSR